MREKQNEKLVNRLWHLNFALFSLYSRLLLSLSVGKIYECFIWKKEEERINDKMGFSADVVSVFLSIFFLFPEMDYIFFYVWKGIKVDAQLSLFRFQEFKWNFSTWPQVFFSQWEKHTDTHGPINWHMILFCIFYLFLVVVVWMILFNSCMHFNKQSGNLCLAIW